MLQPLKFICSSLAVFESVCTRASQSASALHQVTRICDEMTDDELHSAVHAMQMFQDEQNQTLGAHSRMDVYRIEFVTQTDLVMTTLSASGARPAYSHQMHVPARHRRYVAGDGEELSVEECRLSDYRRVSVHALGTIMIAEKHTACIK